MSQLSRLYMVFSIAELPYSHSHVKDRFERSTNIYWGLSNLNVTDTLCHISQETWLSLAKNKLVTQGSLNSSEEDLHKPRNLFLRILSFYHAFCYYQLRHPSSRHDIQGLQPGALDECNERAMVKAIRLLRYDCRRIILTRYSRRDSACIVVGFLLKSAFSGCIRRQQYCSLSKL